MALKSRHILGLREMEKEEIELILDTAESFKEILSRPIKKVPTLRGKSIVNLFYEPSTRTRVSFEVAAKILSAETSSIAVSTSSVVKGESLKDTVKTLKALGCDLLVIRHFSSGAPYFVSKIINCPVINAGDGCHEHPTQGLLDLFTIREKKGKLSGLKVVIVGDILHSRVARSDIWGLNKLGAKVRICGPRTMIPQGVERLGVEVYSDLRKAISRVDVIIMLRLQLERQKGGLFPTLKEYSSFFGLNKENLKLAKEDALVMHPGPINRGVEIMPEVADGLHSVIEEQVTNGLAIRMSLLYLLLGGKRDSP